MSSEAELLACFNMPSGQTITGRLSSIRNAFVAAVVPTIQPKPLEVEKVLAILGQNPEDVRCSYCGDKATEWDHLRPLVTNGKPTGYPSSIRNLVPACGKCNQSKGKSDWKTWIRGKARLSPSARGKTDIAERIAHLEQYERWADCQPLNIEGLVDQSEWKKYLELQEEIFARMREAQKIANGLKRRVSSATSRGVFA